MIRTFEPHDMNPLVHFIMEQSEQIGGEGYIEAKQDNVIQFIKDSAMSPNTKIYIAENNQQIKGYACVEFCLLPWSGKKISSIIMFYVAPKYREGHTESMLYDYIEQESKINDCHCVIYSNLMYDENYQCQTDFMDREHIFFSKKMNECGKCYVKEIV